MPTDRHDRDRVPAPHHLKAWADAYQRDPPLYTLPPVTMGNGAKLPGIVCVCSGCGKPVDRECARGRVAWSLPTVVTVEATGYCQPCSRITRIHCRFREHGKAYQLEWLGPGDHWRRAIIVHAPTIWSRIVSWLKALIA